eukprot:CAMPEP_0198309420 /NCGR_PEP_ID=MMETSP1450-20131203/1818_1 /TAXON_ID=753684 ORGANISM="Madagascaria erythrocladiodes, Strain CCMP3234" /NCGR_SAMPLE_ID=MMETSP1450 /ASSEMBLY_ACC=CAM_ASM_001115 /LENGTH=169 /DNA_ID=CAMNT_0044012177 /DNA_START=124 /DNA_END=629 /DNA_ORIENTATION=+
MTTLRRFTCDDLFKFNNVNLDVLTATYNNAFYADYFVRWPGYQSAAVAPDGTVMAYVFGKAEGKEHNWHGHVTAVTVACEYRQLGMATMLMELLERVSEHIYNGYFVDLYVRASNNVAIEFYKRLGYVVYRTVQKYYSGTEDGLDMRKALPRDTHKLSVKPPERTVVQP